MQTANYYGFPNKTIAKALTKVLSMFRKNSHIAFFWNSGGKLSSMQSLLQFLLEVEENRTAQLKVFQVGDGRSESFLCKNTIPELDLKNIISEIFSTQNDSIIDISKIKDAVKEGLDRICHYEIKPITEHGEAIDEIWKNEIEFHDKDKKKPLRATALIVDDRVDETKDDSTDYLIKAACFLWSLGITTFLTESISKMEKGCLKELGKEWNEPENTLVDVKKDNDKNLNLELCNIDLILLDIAAKSKDSSGEDEEVLDFIGIKHNLHHVTRERTILPFPQVFMLSNLRRESISHLCSALGADYYIEKSELQFKKPFQLSKILRHTIEVDRGHTTDTDDKVPEPDPSWIKVLSFDKNSSNENSFSPDDLHRLGHCLYGQFNKLSELELIREIVGGQSGAITLEVQPKIKGNKVKLRIRLMKIAGKYEMAAELQAYQKYIQPFVNSGFARIENLWAVQKQYAAISYEYAGKYYKIDSSKLSTFYDYFKISKNSETDFRIFLNNIYSSLDQLHNQKISGEELVDEWEVWKYYRKRLGSNILNEWTVTGNVEEQYQILSVRKRGISDISITIGHKLKKENNPGDMQTWYLECKKDENPLGPVWMVRPGKTFYSLPPQKGSEFIITDVCMRLDRFVKDKVKTNETKKLYEYIKTKIKTMRLEQIANELATRALNSGNKVPWGITHGDVHSMNILLTTEKNINNNIDEHWFIDYALSEPGPPAVDFVIMEWDLRERFLVQKLGEALIDQQSEPSVWYDKVKEAIINFENLVAGGQPEAESSILSDIDTNSFNKVLFSIRHIREEIAFKHETSPGAKDNGIYSGRYGRRDYALVFFLQCIRVLHRYNQLVKAELGPVGIIWAALTANSVYENYLSNDEHKKPENNK